MQVALKCADLGHLASPRVVHRKWVGYLEEEFFRQGDREKHNTLSVSPLMDRDKNGITKSQVRCRRPAPRVVCPCRGGLCTVVVSVAKLVGGRA
jgi:hypothetical protein